MLKLSSILCFSLLATASWLCNIPVFRYALERWRPDNCRIIIFSDGKLSSDHELLVSQLELAQRLGKSNIEIIRSDVRSESNREWIELWKSFADGKDATLPYVVARSSVGPGKLINNWNGKLDQQVLVGLLDSPVRKKLIERILAGDSAVWLLLKSTDPIKSKEMKNRLQAELKKLETELELPEGIGEQGSELHSEVPLFLRFTVLEIDPNDPKEQYLSKLISGFHPNATAEGDPLIVPVFGRGRALEVIPASRLDNGLIGDLARFFCAACSCQVKEKNPGFDLLLSVDWNRELFGEDGFVPKQEDGQGQAKRSPDGPKLLTIPSGKK